VARDVLKCSFCGKTQEQVVKIIAGPGVYICDQCIALCNKIVDEEVRGRPEGVAAAEIDDAAREAREAIERLRLLARQRLAGDDDEPE